MSRSRRAGCRLLLAKLGVRRVDLFLQVGNAAFLDADIALRVIEAGLSRPQSLIRLKQLDQRDIGRTHL